MTDSVHTIIGDIFEISNDIESKRLSWNMKNPIYKIRYSYLRRRLNKLIRKFTDKKYIILDKFNIRELFSYILTYYDGKFNCIRSINLINNGAGEKITATVGIGSDDPDISHISYYFTIDQKPNMEIIIHVQNVDRSSTDVSLRKANLNYDSNNLELMNEKLIKEINDNLLAVLYNFLNENIIERYKEKGYMKEIKL